MSRQEEVGNPAFPLRSTYVLARLARVVQRMLERSLAPHDLTLPQYTTLTVLMRRPGLSNAQLARRAYITPQSMQEVLRTLEQRGLVQRTPSSGNRRVLEAVLTAAGRKLVARVERDAGAVEDAMLAGLRPAERTRFARSLQQCVARLGGGLDARVRASGAEPDVHPPPKIAQEPDRRVRASRESAARCP